MPGDAAAVGTGSAMGAEDVAGGVTRVGEEAGGATPTTGGSEGFTRVPTTNAPMIATNTSTPPTRKSGSVDLG